jgi:hypothetical protein
MGGTSRQLAGSLAAHTEIADILAKPGNGEAGVSALVRILVVVIGVAHREGGRLSTALHAELGQQ